MNTFYTSEINTQMLICLMKKHGIKKVVASPGATNVCFVASLQQDDFLSCILRLMKGQRRILPAGLQQKAVNLWH